MSTDNQSYYIPHTATWPIITCAGIALFLIGFANLINQSSIGEPMMMVGFAIIIVAFIGWFGLQAKESEDGFYNARVGISFRMGMMWFIFSEVMFFAAFFGALFYARIYSIPWLAGEGGGPGMSSDLLWSGFEAVWPTNGPGNVGGEYEAMGAWGLPAVNTFILLSSGVTVTWAHHALLANHRKQLIVNLAATVFLGFLFVFLQAVEYHEAYTEMGLTLGSGIYGTTFFMLTGFHGLHVTIGSIILAVVLFRCIRGHFTAENHFAFEAAAWYWHFVDVVWLILFIFVYWM